MCVYTHTHTYTYPGILLSQKSEIIALAATWMNLEVIILGETGQKEETCRRMQPQGWVLCPSVSFSCCLSIGSIRHLFSISTLHVFFKNRSFLQFKGSTWPLTDRVLMVTVTCNPFYGLTMNDHKKCPKRVQKT